MTTKKLLKSMLWRKDCSTDGAGLIPALQWALDIIEMQEERLIELGDPERCVRSEVHESAKSKAKRDLFLARQILEGETKG